MIRFKVSVPCKLSLFGEYAPKYGKISLTAAMDLRTTLIFNELPPLPSKRSLRLIFHQTNLVLQKFVVKFQNFYSDCIENIILLRERVLQYTDDWRETPNHKIVQAFYYLLVFITYKENIKITSFAMHLSTQFMDDELACPASFSVCLAASLLHLSRLQKGVHDTFDQVDLQKINLYATRCEEIFSESGMVNVTTCTYGLMMKYQILQMGPTVISSREIPMPILLVDTKQTQSLEAQTQRIAELCTILPVLVSSIFNSIDIITNRAYYVFLRLINIHKDNNIDVETRHIRILQEHNELKRKSMKCAQNIQILVVVDMHIFGVHDICIAELCVHMTLIPQELKTHGFDVTETNLVRSGVKIEIMT